MVDLWVAFYHCANQKRQVQKYTEILHFWQEMMGPIQFRRPFPPERTFL